MIGIYPLVVSGCRSFVELDLGIFDLECVFKNRSDPALIPLRASREESPVGST
jgi:hypothetical protein